CHNYLDIEDKGGCKKVDTKFKAVISGDKRRDESFHAYGVQAERLHWSLSLIKSSQQRMLLIFEEYKLNDDIITYKNSLTA
ncbi:hypothetical protein HO839_05690, partial [Streptococcus suis]|nr:hypothetical protein [Streptococcus suis]